MKEHEEGKEKEGRVRKRRRSSKMNERKGRIEKKKGRKNKRRRK